MKPKKVAIFLAIIMCVAVVLTMIFVFTPKDNNTNIPTEITRLIEDYMTAYKTGTEAAVEFTYFNDDFRRQAYIDSGDYLIDYEVKSIVKVNENLYAISVLVKTAQTESNSGDGMELVYNFAVKVDGNWKYVNGVSNIPESDRINLDVSQYTYDDENIVG